VEDNDDQMEPSKPMVENPKMMEQDQGSAIMTSRIATITPSPLKE